VENKWGGPGVWGGERRTGIAQVFDNSSLPWEGKFSTGIRVWT